MSIEWKRAEGYRKKVCVAIAGFEWDCLAARGIKKNRPKKINMIIRINNMSIEWKRAEGYRKKVCVAIAGFEWDCLAARGIKKNRPIIQ